MIHVILATGAAERFTVLLGFLTALLILLGMMGRGIKRGFGAVWELVEATQENTRAVTKLNTRMTKVEVAVGLAQDHEETR